MWSDTINSQESPPVPLFQNVPLVRSTLGIIRVVSKKQTQPTSPALKNLAFHHIGCEISYIHRIEFMNEITEFGKWHPPLGGHPSLQPLRALQTNFKHC